MQRVKLTLFLLVPQAVFFILFGLFVDYDDSSTGPLPENTTADASEFNALYPMYQDVHVMIFIGFGFLMTFLKRYGYGSVGFNFMLAVFALQWAILLRGFFDREGFADGKINLSLDNFLNADFASASVLISFGAVLGVLNPIQLLVMVFLEIIFYTVNEFIIIELFQISDIGGSLVIHAFGAYFGLAVSLLHWKNELRDHPKEGSNYNSDLFAMIGTLFLWVYWPSFNASPEAGTMLGQRAVITTVLSLSAATVSAFSWSSVLNKSGKFSMVHIQNATLAGGVAVGSLANLRLGAVGAIGVGAFSGMLSVIGYKFITPVMMKKLRIHDTCGVNNLHGMPGILSGCVAVILARYTSADTYSSKELKAIYPGMNQDNLDFSWQAKMQLAGLAVTLGLSVVGGLITGVLLKIPFLSNVNIRTLFDDAEVWLLEDTESENGNRTPLEIMESIHEEENEKTSFAEDDNEIDDTTLGQEKALIESESD